MKPEEAVSYLGDISIGRLPIMPGSTNSAEVIDKLPNESKILREGLATYDVRFYATSPKGGKTPAEYRLIVNIEGQKAQKPGYDLTTREIVYCVRQISEQLGRNITHGHYERVEKVYSIWIVMDCSQESANTISEARWTYRDLAGHYEYHPRIDIERVVMIRLPRDNEWEKAKNKAQPIHEMLATLLSNDIQPAEKLETLSNDFNIPVTETLREEVENMCNYSSAIRNEGYREGRDKGYNEGSNNRAEENALRMIRGGKLTNEEIADYTGFAISHVVELRKEEEDKMVMA